MACTLWRTGTEASESPMHFTFPALERLMVPVYGSRDGIGEPDTLNLLNKDLLKAS